jgi:glycerol-3-phosphate dehydrogenase (NAD(P)+)
MLDQRIQNISVYGAGSWGTALALQLARNGINVLLWDFNADYIADYKTARENIHFLAGIPFPDTLQCTDKIEECIHHSHNQLVVVPSHGFRQLLEKLAPQLTPQHNIVWATKGLEVGTGKLLHEVADEILDKNTPYGLVSGPTFALEVAQGLPTAMTVATTTAELSHRTAQAFQSDSFRVYTSDDILGVELGGAVKNVLAIAAGISDGLGFGANARSAIITRGLAEIIRLGERMGAKSETIMGLAGIGDLILTCTDDQSRNRRLGLALGKGQSIEDAVKKIGQAVEGVKSSSCIELLAQRANIEMPICTEVYRIVHQNLDPQAAVKELLSRHIRPEF